MCSALYLRPGAPCWQGKQARKASCRSGNRPRKTPRPQAVAGRLPGWTAHQSLASELPGTSLAWCQQLLLGPFAESHGDKTEPSFRRDTKWSLHRALLQSGPTQTSVLMQERGLKKHKVQYPSRSRIWGLDRIINNATGI